MDNYFTWDKNWLVIVMVTVLLDLGKSESIAILNEYDNAELYHNFKCSDSGDVIAFNEAKIAAFFSFQNSFSHLIGLESRVRSIKFAITARSNDSDPTMVQMTFTATPSTYQRCYQASEWTWSNQTIQWNIEGFIADHEYYSPDIKDLLFENFGSLMWRKKRVFELIISLKLATVNSGSRTIYSYEGAGDNETKRPYLLVEYDSASNEKILLLDKEDDGEVGSNFQCELNSGDIDLESAKSMVLLNFRDLDALGGSMSDIDTIKIRFVVKNHGSGDLKVDLKRLLSGSYGLVCSATTNLNVSQTSIEWDVPNPGKGDPIYTSNIKQLLVEHLTTANWNSNRLFQVIINLNALDINSGKREFLSFESKESESKMPALQVGFKNGSQAKYSIQNGNDDIEITKACIEQKDNLEMVYGKSAVSLKFKNLDKLKNMQYSIKSIMLRVTSASDQEGAMVVQLTYRKELSIGASCSLSTEEDWSTQYVNWSVPSFVKDQSYDSPDIKELLFANFDSGTWNIHKTFELIISLNLLPQGSPKRQVYSFKKASAEEEKIPHLIVSYKKDFQCSTTLELSGFAIIKHTFEILNAANAFECCKKCLKIGHLCKSYGEEKIGPHTRCELYNITKEESHKKYYYKYGTSFNHYTLNIEY